MLEEVPPAVPLRGERPELPEPHFPFKAAIVTAVRRPDDVLPSGEARRPEVELTGELANDPVSFAGLHRGKLIPQRRDIAFIRGESSGLEFPRGEALHAHEVTIALADVGTVVARTAATANPTAPRLVGPAERPSIERIQDVAKGSVLLHEDALYQG